MLRRLYLSPLGYFISLILRMLATLVRPFMVYGYRDRTTGQFNKLTRIGSTVILGDRNNISIGDNVWIAHYSIIDGSYGVKIGTGVQICAWCGIYSHGSHLSIRLMGSKYVETPHEERVGYTRGSVEIGDYTFVGSHTLILPGTKIGKGCRIASGSVVSGEVPDFSIVKGDPAILVGDVRDIDKYHINDEEVKKSYFDKEALLQMQRGDY